ncbi:hypothetical protein PMAYCL1PPCAC_20804 [Pristionchus mayeri]|uniref:Uncharacterized protein n=1 Tax=Pristionchus mayeri TaxID=1317129 RepID=A0AAN5I3T7_9BILA|nr:hypothetical protein PMAYCL1PPCAC_20804 [Pristionchus mayeri]
MRRYSNLASLPPFQRIVVRNIDLVLLPRSKQKRASGQWPRDLLPRWPHYPHLRASFRPPCTHFDTRDTQQGENHSNLCTSAALYRCFRSGDIPALLHDPSHPRLPYAFLFLFGIRTRRGRGASHTGCPGWRWRHGGSPLQRRL